MSDSYSLKDRLILFGTIIIMSLTVFNRNTEAGEETTKISTMLSEEDVRENGQGLSDGKLAIYEACVYAMKESPDSYVMLDLPAAKDDLGEAYKAFEYDYPEADIRAENVVIAVNKDDNIIGIKPSIIEYPDKDYDFEFPGLTSDTALGIFKFVKQQCFYTKDPEAFPGVVNSAYALYLKDGEMVCEGYAKLYKILLDKAGIPNRIVVSENMGHAWNIVWLEEEGRWVECDPTWDDSWAEKVWTYDQYGEDRPVFLFGLTTEEMEERHGFKRYDYCDNIPVAE